MKRLSTLAIACAIFVATAPVALGQTVTVTEEIEEAVAALKQDPENNVLRNELVGLYYEQGVEDLQNNLINEASVSFEAALDIATEKDFALDNAVENVRDLRYALAYSYSLIGNNQAAIEVLEQLVSDVPKMESARYLLGISLIRTLSEENIERGKQVLLQLQQDLPEDQVPIISLTLSRILLNLASVDYAKGNFIEARKKLEWLKGEFGLNSASSATENNHLTFSRGVYRRAGGDLDGALTEFVLLNNRNPNYKLIDGLTIPQELYYVYYRLGFSNLQLGNYEEALILLDRATTVDYRPTDKEAVYAAHLKAIALNGIGDQDGVQQQLAVIRDLDPVYYSDIVFFRVNR